MTRWLQAAKQEADPRTKLTEPTKPAPKAIEGGAGTTERGVLSVSSVLSERGKADPAPPVATPPLDAEGLPFAPCPGCGGGDWWKPWTLPLEGAGWRCVACDPPPPDRYRHACAVPPGGRRPARNSTARAVALGGDQP
jgi:hypothetical protein